MLFMDSDDAMKSYLLRPEVAGGMGPSTELDATVHPPMVRRLHYEFAGWLGNDIAETFPCIIVTERLGDALVRSGVMGFELDDVLVTKDPQFEELFPEEAAALPAWRWLRLDAVAGGGDMWQDAAASLHVNEKALTVLRAFRLEACEVVEE